MHVFLNGRFVPEECAVVSVFDRGFLYGDGVFETVLVSNGRPFRWAAHLDRFQRGAEFLKIKLSCSPAALHRFAGQLIAKNQMPEALLRLTLSRGVGVRGYSPQGATAPTLVMTLHAAPKVNLKNPPRWKLITASPRLPAGESQAQFKTANKLSQILARAEADAAGADEALLLNTDGNVVEASAGNLFWIERNTICTPPLASGILPGVTRAVVLEISRSLGLKTREAQITPAKLRRAAGAFVSLSSWGVVEVQSLDGHKLEVSALTALIRDRYWACVGVENA